MDQPLGKEWNTRVGFQRGTLPRVVKKVRSLAWILIAVCVDLVAFEQPGVIIDPLEKMV
jgi:U3 small nucleolar RNA-associated protein 14